MKTEHEICWAIKKILDGCAARVPEHSHKLNTLTIETSHRMTRCAGKANPAKNLIKISIPFFENDDNFTNELYEIVTHEVAHILAPPTRGNTFDSAFSIRRPKRDIHGPAFKAMHKRLGGTGKRTHSMELAQGHTKAERHEVPCSACGKSMTLGPIQYKKHLSRVRIGAATYRHTRCPR